MRPNINIGEERERHNIAIVVHRIVGDVDISLTDSLTFDAYKVDSILLRVVLNYLRNRKPIHSEEVGVSTLPHNASRKVKSSLYRAPVNLHR